MVLSTGQADLDIVPIPAVYTIPGDRSGQLPHLGLSGQDKSRENGPEMDQGHGKHSQVRSVSGYRSRHGHGPSQGHSHGHGHGHGHGQGQGQGQDMSKQEEQGYHGDFDTSSRSRIQEACSDTCQYVSGGIIGVFLVSWCVVSSSSRLRNSSFSKTHFTT